MRKFGFYTVIGSTGLLLFSFMYKANAASEHAKEQAAARKACLSGNIQNGVDILSDLFIQTKDPVHIYNQGRCFEQNDRCEEAISRFREYLRNAKKLSREEKSDAEKHIAECQKLLDQKSMAEPGRTTIGSDPVRAGDTKPPVRETTPVKETATAPTAVATLPPATTHPETTTPNSSQLVTSPSLAESNPGRGLRIAGITCGVVGLGSIGTAIYFYTKARSYAEKVSRQTVINSSDDSAGKRAETMQWVFYGVGGAALATGVVLYALGWPSNDANQPNTSVAPLFGPGLAGISAQGRF